MTFSDQDVDLVARVIGLRAGSAYTEPEREVYRGDARAVLDALDRADRLRAEYIREYLEEVDRRCARGGVSGDPASCRSGDGPVLAGGGHVT